MADTLIYAPIRSMTGDGKSAYASQVWDEEQQKFQSEINKNAYAKPDSGIPKSDMADGVKQSLEKADSSLQGITQEEFNEIFN